MKSIDRWLRWGRKRLTAMPAGRRAALVVAAAAALVGLGWMAFSGSPRMVPVLDRPWTPSELAEAKEVLAARGIEHRLDSGRLVVPASRLHEARAALQDGADAAGQSKGLEQLALKEDIWSSQSQIAKRWQGAKMAAMARLIRRFPQVRSASVIFEEGEARGLSGGGAEPTAVVGVELKTGSAVSGELVDAIADVVAGGVAGMKRQNVRIVEASGRSYRATEAALADSPVLRQIQAAETFYTRKVRSAIPRIEGVVVAVRVEPQEPMPRCAEVRVSIPRSHFVAVVRASTGAARPDDAAVQSAVAAGTEQVRDMVAFALGEKDSARIKADCYQDAPEAADGGGVSPAARAENPWPLWAGAAACGVILWASVARLLRRRGAVTRAAGARPRGVPGSDFSQGAMGVLQWASVEDILSFVGDEHPQMAAVVLASVPAEKGAAVLAALPPEAQQEVCRRLASMEQVEPQMLRDVDRAIAGRLAERARSDRPAAGGPAKLADLLHKAGPQTRRHVLEALSRDLPQLAESLGRSPLAFEDIASLSESRLASVLEDVDSRLLAVALRTASKPLVQKVFACLSSPAARLLRAQMERVGPVRLSDVESAQQKIAEELQGSRTETGTGAGWAPLGAESGRYAPAAGSSDLPAAAGEQVA